MSKINWYEMSEEQKYAHWSDYVENGGIAFSYPAYCDLVEAIALSLKQPFND